MTVSPKWTTKATRPSKDTCSLWTLQHPRPQHQVQGQAGSRQPHRTHQGTAAGQGGGLPQGSRATRCRRAAQNVWRKRHLPRELTYNKGPEEKTHVGGRLRQTASSRAWEAGDEAQGPQKEAWGRRTASMGSVSCLALSLRSPRASNKGEIHQVCLFKGSLWQLCNE